MKQPNGYCIDVFDQPLQTVKRKNDNYTDYMESKLVQFNNSHVVEKSEDATYSSGIYFESINEKWFVEVLGFIPIPSSQSIHEPIMDIFSCDFELPNRVVKRNVPFKSTLEYAYEWSGKINIKNKKRKTEFVLYSRDAKPTIDIPIKYFNKDGSLYVRVEDKTQNVSGTSFEKIKALVPELYNGAPEKNVIFLVTGFSMSDDNYLELKYLVSKCGNDKNILIMNEKQFVDWSLEALSIENINRLVTEE